MLFNSFEFVGLLLATFLLYYLPPLRRWQLPILLLASMAFYASAQPQLLWLLLASIGLNAASSYAVLRASSPQAARPYATLGVVANLSLLAFFKYSGLMAHTFLPADGELSAFLTTLPLPLGISFFSFQGISLVVDVYRAKGKAEQAPAAPWTQHLLHTTFFISFFAKLVQGPIAKAGQFMPQIGPKRYRDIQWEPIFRALVMGYFLKMVVADNLKDQTFWIAYPYFETRSTLSLLSMLLGYSMQIFADFAGYSLIAIGVGGLFGYRLPDNFNFPYISTSVADFWRRWHISLSTFLKEYLYIPLGGNRHGQGRTYFNLMMTMVLGGIWHGAGWSYALWGAVHGGALAIERFCKDRFSLPQHPVVSLLQWAAVFTMVSWAWLFFKLPEFSHVVGFMQSVVRNTHLSTWPGNLTYIALYALPVLVYHASHVYRAAGYNDRWIVAMRPLTYGFMLFCILTNSGAAGDFIYFQF